MKNLALIQKTKRRAEHGGLFSVKRRRSRRPLNIKKPVHLVLRSDLAKGKRSLLRNQRTVLRVLEKFSRRFQIRVYKKAICGNHIHCLVKAPSRKQLQYFFRVFAGQVAQEILRDFPLQKHEFTPKPKRRGGTPNDGRRKEPCYKNQRTFWSLLAYTRIVSWGRDYLNVKAYVVRNTLEALGLIPYIKRNSRFMLDLPTSTA